MFGRIAVRGEGVGVVADLKKAMAGVLVATGLMAGPTAAEGAVETAAVLQAGVPGMTSQNLVVVHGGQATVLPGIPMAERVGCGCPCG